MFELNNKHIFAKSNILPASELVKKTGRLVYTEEQVQEVYDPLTRLFRKTLFNEGITLEYLKFKYREYCRDIRGLRPDQVQHQMTNLAKALYRGNLTFSMFKQLMESLGYPVVKLTVLTIKDDQMIEFNSD